jgi:hypothetical protein
LISSLRFYSGQASTMTSSTAWGGIARKIDTGRTPGTNL